MLMIENKKIVDLKTDCTVAGKKSTVVHIFFLYKYGLIPSFTPHHNKSRQKGTASGSGSFIQENTERKLKTFVKVSEIPHSKFQ